MSVPQFIRYGTRELFVTVAGCLAVLLTLAILTWPLWFLPYMWFTEGALSIRNMSGMDVRFERIEVSGKVLWADPDVILPSVRNFEKPYLDPASRGLLLRFTAPKKTVELKAVVILDDRHRETVRCMLNNDMRPCFFEIDYLRGSIVCRGRTSMLL
ncbi:MAG: hypothetical protein AB1646_17850 [Thermodesulfobacteriota bacterium]